MGGGTPVLTNVRAHQRSICLTNSCKLCYTFQRSARAHFNTASMMLGDASDDDDLNVSRCARACGHLTQRAPKYLDDDDGRTEYARSSETIKTEIFRPFAETRF